MLYLSIGKKEESGDDRLCSTAMAANTLLYTWMNGKNLISSVPQAVINVVTGAVHWMVKNAKGPAYNVLFSGSMKTADVSVVGERARHSQRFAIYIL